MKKTLMIFSQKFINFLLFASEPLALLQPLEDAERPKAQGGRGLPGCRVQLDLSSPAQYARKCQTRADHDSNQTQNAQNEHLELDVNVLVKIIINRSTHMQYTVYTYKEVTLLIMSLITTLVPE